MPDDLAKMPYTRRAIDESLRIHPPVFGITRRAIEADEIGGFPIEKGAQVLVSPYSVHRHPAFWPDPERFDPDRFLPDRAKHRPRFAHFPFGGGPRQCIGNAFAMMELQVLVPAMIGALRFDLAEGSDTTPEPRMTYRPRGPVKMYARPA
jgi:cytochrome P450